jgi:hypothetical protein
MGSDVWNMMDGIWFFTKLQCKGAVTVNICFSMATHSTLMCLSKLQIAPQSKSPPPTENASFNVTKFQGLSDHHKINHMME